MDAYSRRAVRASRLSCGSQNGRTFHNPGAPIHAHRRLPHDVLRADVDYPAHALKERMPAGSLSLVHAPTLRRCWIDMVFLLQRPAVPRTVAMLFEQPITNPRQGIARQRA